MRAEYPDQLDYSGHAQISQQTKAGNNSLRLCTAFPHSSFPPQQPQMVPSGLEPETLWLLAIRSDQLSYESSWPLQLLGEGFMLPFLFAHLKTAHHSQSARVVKGVDLRCNCAWVQTPWLTLSRVQASCLTPSTSQVHGYLTMFSSPHGLMDKALDL